MRPEALIGVFVKQLNAKVADERAALIVENGELKAEIAKLQAELARIRGLPRLAQLDAEIGLLRARVSQLEQAPAQAGDSIELQEAEQRGFERGRAFEEKT